MKVCTKCKIEKPFTEFYKDSSRISGYEYVCKSCQNDRMRETRKQPEFLEHEKIRAHNKYERNKAAINLRNTNWRRRNPDKTYCDDTAKHLRKKGLHKHHWNYNKEFALDVIYLTPGNHILLHKKLLYDTNSKCFLRSDTNQLLNTKELHLNFITETLGIKL